MSDNPGDPDATDPEATSPDQAEAAAAEAARADAVRDAADEGFAEEDLADIDAALAGVDQEFAEDPAAQQAEVADAEAEHAAGEGTVDDGLTRQLAERTEDLQRLNAEYTNYRRRTERERAAAVDQARASVIAQLLPILDDLALAKKHGDLDEGPLKAFADKLTNTLESLGLKAFGAPGEEFDPEIHEAVQDMSSGDEKVLGEVLRRGYLLGEKTVRTAMVIIGDPADGAAAPEDGQEAE
ncbi:heat shock protein GrpE [Corynebacterium atypicum]|uniref:Protein GrpE n=2 Tax=Corynebacterium atypicum TaxID=191610 RepID=A0ABN4DH79_9CORY|nr:heat shock protein GrpE [Corynebacterium atypicum]